MRSKGDPSHSLPLTTTTTETNRDRDHHPLPTTRKHPERGSSPRSCSRSQDPPNPLHKNKRGVVPPTIPRAARHAPTNPPRRDGSANAPPFAPALTPRWLNRTQRTRRATSHAPQRSQREQWPPPTSQRGARRLLAKYSVWARAGNGARCRRQ
ncbi:hypothetical protein BD410DRAFT_825515 [Rickenella mellea]|uniref:Uncharacterized protein n=1 Tax=Rickenella mellea TaxID=50990 RepID=A0A4Y7QJ31_9AGAM|nr:hypothetical protein BD410DRAFT_825515 [Rickenella mellea]